MNGLHKRVRIGKYAIPVLLLATLTIGTVSAVAYVVLTWQLSLTVAPNPRVHFWNGAAASNTMTVAMNIFPSIRTIDENITTPIDWDIKSVAAGNIFLRVSAMDTADVTEVIIKAYKTGQVGSPLFSQTWSAQTTTWSGPYLTAASTDYHLWIEVQAAGSATNPASISVEMKVESP